MRYISLFSANSAIFCGAHKSVVPGPGVQCQSSPVSLSYSLIAWPKLHRACVSSLLVEFSRGFASNRGWFVIGWFGGICKLLSVLDVSIDRPRHDHARPTVGDLTIIWFTGLLSGPLVCYMLFFWQNMRCAMRSIMLEVRGDPIHLLLVTCWILLTGKLLV